MKVIELLEADYNFNSLYNRIKRDCKPYLSVNPLNEHRPMYRGFSTIERSVRLPTPKDRHPRNSTIELHKAYDQYFYNEFNHPYRSNAVFATGSLRMANGYTDNAADYVNRYSNVTIIFPAGNFDFCWSPKIEDLYNLQDDMIIWNEYAEQFDEVRYAETTYDKEQAKNHIIRHASSADIEKFVTNELLPSLGYRENDDLSKAIASGHEIMINCDHYYAIRYPLYNKWLLDKKVQEI